MTVRIRRMVKRDKPSIMAILRRTPEFKTSEVVVAEEVIDSYLKDPVNSGYYALVSEDGDGITGYICYGPTPLTEGTWDLYWEAVAPEKKRRGIGTALMEAAEAAIIEARGRLAVIETSSTQAYESARGLHQSRGYETIARIPDFYSPGDDKLILIKRLG